MAEIHVKKTDVRSHSNMKCWNIPGNGFKANAALEIVSM